MGSPKSENKKRVLPSWMTAPEDERRELSAKTPKRKRRAAVQEGVATRAPATKTVYCMNEAEMVDVALGILIEGQKQETASLVTTDKLQLSPPYSASPHTSSPGSSSEEEGSGSSSPALDLSPSQGPEATDSPCSSSPKDEKEEEDVLKYVREIFFS
ncbi:cell cycle regulator of non-homologous end joining [Alexandromys fortis]|uniref:cell cycle regulator of non-homologous end joining n=1 Tax=Alexandromys fortis TaxID=100897 RepID=UPI002153004A|nr:cell cycle regulator of non-homologous end joining [Microtus fortis]XP_050003986.1 cell cycle regulator of non-homologous end joining [Microtus fortis]XP_050003987.1 cell cycle regulator of non-homologous end joining [Microtus fortis]XP_050003988.1 cell cycle regulator of non-homologous end joining [Microtus fortis]